MSGGQGLSVLVTVCSACDAGDGPLEDEQDDRNAVVGSLGESLFRASSVWQQFLCVGDEDCLLADVNGDGLDDAVAIKIVRGQHVCNEASASERQAT